MKRRETGKIKKLAPGRNKNINVLIKQYTKYDSRLIQTLHALLISISSEVIITGDFRFVNCFFKIRI